jgi:putative glutamine amidotransferase
MKRVALTYRNPNKVAPYAAVFQRAGVEPVLISPVDGVDSIGCFDGLVLTGGSDVNPKLYGQAPDPHNDPPDDERDAMEQRFIREAVQKQIPLLAICRGMQLFNVVQRGGSLIQHIEGHAVRSGDPPLAVHTIETEPGTRLAQILPNREAPVNSRHHQTIGELGAGLIVSARAPDGVVEGIELPIHPFAIGVQWHPEDQAARFPEQMHLFEAFRDAL